MSNLSTFSLFSLSSCLALFPDLPVLPRISQTHPLLEDPSPHLCSASWSPIPLHPTLSSVRRWVCWRHCGLPQMQSPSFRHALCPGRPVLPSGSWLDSAKCKDGQGGQGEWASSLLSPKGFGSWLVALSSAIIPLQVLVIRYSRGKTVLEKEKESCNHNRNSWGSSIRERIPSRGLHPPDPMASWRLHLQIPPHWGLGL